MKRVLVFDLDGTLVLTMDQFAEIAANLLFLYYLIPKSSGKHLYLTSSGIPFGDQLSRIRPHGEFNTLIEDAFENQKEEVAASVCLGSDASEALHQLQKRGHWLCISSNSKQRHVADFVSKSPVRFDVALGLDNGNGKGRVHFDAICSELHCTRADMTFIGDSIYDQHLAKSEGVDFIARLGTFMEHDFRFYDDNVPVVKELRELMRFRSIV